MRDFTRGLLRRLLYALACVAAVGLGMVAMTQWRVHHAPASPPAVAPSVDPAAAVFAAHQRVFTAQLAALDVRYGCLTPEEWNRRQSMIWPRQYPASMIVQPVMASGQPTWGLVVEPWSFSNVGGYVEGLCLR